MIKVCVAGIVIILVAVFAKSIRNEYGIYAGMAGSILLMYLGIRKFSGILDIINKCGSYISIGSGYMEILIKMLGIAYIAEFASGISKDAGYSAIADQIELIGKLSILLISTPIIEALLNTIFSFINN